MTNFLVTWLDDEDLAHVTAILSNVKDVSTVEAAVKWALKQSASKLPPVESKPAEVKVVGVEKAPSPPPGGVTFDPDVETVPLGKHNCVVIPLSRLAQLGHTVVVASGTLERLIPDVAARKNLLGGNF